MGGKLLMFRLKNKTQTYSEDKNRLTAFITAHKHWLVTDVLSAPFPSTHTVVSCYEAVTTRRLLHHINMKLQQTELKRGHLCDRTTTPSAKRSQLSYSLKSDAT